MYKVIKNFKYKTTIYKIGEIVNFKNKKDVEILEGYIVPIKVDKPKASKKEEKKEEKQEKKEE